MASLQERFKNSKGNPILVGSQTVIQLDEIPIVQGEVVISFLARNTSMIQGVALKAPKGGVIRSDGKKTELLFIWDRTDLPKVVRHQVICPGGLLKIWNIYKIKDDGDLTKADAWTNNSGMVVSLLGQNKRRYCCSNGRGEFDPGDLKAEVTWLDG